MKAAVEGGRGDEDEKATEKAKVLYKEMKGSAEGFDKELKKRAKALPYHAEEYSAPSDWKGKAVLAELFTGSECPPCVGADLGFDGLIESYPQKYLVILQYHLPIPGPDPMMNPSTKLRQDYYGVNSTPTVVIDGTETMRGGGSRGMAEGKFQEYKAAIDPLIRNTPAVDLTIQANLDGSKLNVVYDFNKSISGADYFLVLVQEEEEYQGSNGLKYHKMVVRDFITLDPSAPKKTTFDLAASEKAADSYLTAFAKSYTRIPNFKWPARCSTIARQGLKVVFFTQDKENKTVLNAVVADVK
jgi:hypothetical protein